MTAIIDVDFMRLRTVADRLATTAQELAAIEPETGAGAGPAEDPAAAMLAQVGAAWSDHLRHLHGALAGTAVALRAVAGTYAGAHDEAATLFTPGWLA